MWAFPLAVSRNYFMLNRITIKGKMQKQDDRSDSQSDKYSYSLWFIHFSK